MEEIAVYIAEESYPRRKRITVADYLKLHKELATQIVYGEWTTEPPTQEGWYWVYTKHEYANEMQLWCVKVDIRESVVDPGKLMPFFDIPAGGYESDEYIHEWTTTHWLGPLPIPEPPKE